MRKAVRVLAWRMPTGWPVAEKRVMAPVGLILGVPEDASCSDCGGVRVITGVVLAHSSSVPTWTAIDSHPSLRHRLGCSRA